MLLLCPRAISLSVVHYIRRDLPRGSLQKPAIEGHFKTGQRTLTLDGLVLPYRTAVWQLQFDPIGSLPSDHQPGILQDLIPVFPFRCRELSFEN